MNCRLAFLLLLAAAGCSAPVNKTESAPPPDKRITIDPSLAGALRVLKVQSATGAEGYLKIQVDVENRSAAPRRFSYSIDWLDANGSLLPQLSNGFLKWMLRGRETSSIAATAPDSLAKDFRITFRGPPK